MIYNIYGQTFRIKDDLFAHGCEWHSNQKIWTTPCMKKNSTKYIKIKSLADVVDAVLIPTGMALLREKKLM